MTKWLRTIGFAFLMICTSNSFAWGFYAHKLVNKMAIFTLPEEMIGFYKYHLNYIEQHAIDADKRRYVNDNEAPKHYIDLEFYINDQQETLDSIPRKWSNAVEKYGKDSLESWGILPWTIKLELVLLTKAFKENDVEAILKHSADLGHYIADANVPLHTTENYNGQLTDQKGIHALWESRIPEAKAESYNYIVGKTNYVKKPDEFIWNLIRKSHQEKEEVLQCEKKLRETIKVEEKYSFQSRGQAFKRDYSEEYVLAYEEKLDGMVERKLQSSIVSLAGFWYTAWLNAGQPDLSSLIEKR